eukprot:gene378-215_t
MHNLLEEKYAQQQEIGGKYKMHSRTFEQNPIIMRSKIKCDLHCQVVKELFFHAEGKYVSSVLFFYPFLVTHMFLYYYHFFGLFS